MIHLRMSDTSCPIRFFDQKYSASQSSWDEGLCWVVDSYLLDAAIDLDSIAAVVRGLNLGSFVCWGLKQWQE